MLTREEFAKISSSGIADVPHDARIWNYTIRSTSGTTGGVPILVVRHVPKDPRSMESTERLLAMGGTLGHRGTLISMFFYAHPGDDDDASIAAVGAESPPPFIEDALKEFNPVALWGVVSYVLKFFNRFPTLALPLLRRVTWGGEYVSDGSVEAGQKRFPNAVFESWYGCAELGNLALPQCQYRSRFEFHPLRGVEVTVDTVDGTGEGALLFSTSLTDSVAIRQYRPGELGTVEHTPCRCGEAVTFTVKGRIDFDVVRVAGAILHVQECDRVMDQLSDLVSDYQVLATETFERGAPRGKLTLTAVPTSSLKSRSQPERFLRDEFQRRLFVTPTRTLAEVVAEQLFEQTEVVFKSEIEHAVKQVRLKRAAA